MVHLLHPNKFYAADPHKLNVSIAKEMHEEIKHYQNGLTEERGIIMKLFLLFLVRIFLYSDWIQENTDQK